MVARQDFWLDVPAEVDDASLTLVEWDLVDVERRM
jgi:hypothetical protein